MLISVFNSSCIREMNVKCTSFTFVMGGSEFLPFLRFASFPARRSTLNVEMPLYLHWWEKGQVQQFTQAKRPREKWKRGNEAFAQERARTWLRPRRVTLPRLPPRWVLITPTVYLWYNTWEVILHLHAARTQNQENKPQSGRLLSAVAASQNTLITSNLFQGGKDPSISV